MTLISKRTTNRIPTRIPTGKKEKHHKKVTPTTPTSTNTNIGVATTTIYSPQNPPYPFSPPCNYLFSPPLVTLKISLTSSLSPVHFSSPSLHLSLAFGSSSSSPPHDQPPAAFLELTKTSKQTDEDKKWRKTQQKFRRYLSHRSKRK
ncbi:hypothetical protein E2C01_074057 [Portunus trituberculatus]|uniref:Uncharacterized protein n=1 Tax=Portunus trituberculatus TaxID=210409 RepID=A0A5B7IFB7_PORTR|nr:hypothetical protein [Portunus trituberculatus]